MKNRSMCYHYMNNTRFLIQSMLEFLQTVKHSVRVAVLECLQ